MVQISQEVPDINGVVVVRSTPSADESFPIVTKEGKNYLCVEILHPAYKLRRGWQCITPSFRLAWMWGHILDGTIVPSALAVQDIAPEERYQVLKNYVDEGYRARQIMEFLERAAKTFVPVFTNQQPNVFMGINNFLARQENTKKPLFVFRPSWEG